MIQTLDKVRLDAAAALTLETGFTVGWSPASATYLTGKGVEGWNNGAPMRRQKSERMGAHGTHAERGWRDERLISVTGHHVAETRADAAAFVDDLNAFLGDGLDGVFSVEDPDLGTRWARVYLAAGAVDITWTGGRDVGFTIHLLAPDARKYGRRIQTPETGVPVAGSGLVFPLFQARQVYTGPGRTNLFINPSFEVSTANVTAANGTMALTSYAPSVNSGTQALSFTAGASPTLFTYVTLRADGITPGRWFGFAAGVKYGSGSRYVRLRVNFHDAANAILSSAVGEVTYGSNATGGARYVVSGQVPAGAAYARAYLYFYDDAAATVAPVGATGWTTDAWSGVEASTQADAEAGAMSYFDGSSAPTGIASAQSSTFAWSGAANASTSVETITTYSGAPGVLDIGAGAYSGRLSVTNEGTADVGPVFTIHGYAPGFTITHTDTGRRLVYSRTIQPGQTLVLDSNDGTVTMDGYSPQDAGLVVAEWVRLGRGETGTWLFESPGSTDAHLTIGLVPAWW